MTNLENINKNPISTLFESTENGVLPITYYSEIGEAVSTVEYAVTWTKEDFEQTAKRFDFLKSALLKIGKLKKELDDKQLIEKLDENELKVFKTFIEPFEPFEVSEHEIGELHMRMDGETLSDEEYELVERHYEWRERESLKRLPKNRTSSYQLVLRAQRYVTLVCLGAPEIICENEARCLAEEFVLYYHFSKDAVNY